jgi:hypothetical protein
MMRTLSERLGRLAVFSAFSLALAVPHPRLEAAEATSFSLLSSQPKCRAGSLQCVDSVVREMTRRFDALASKCDHKAVFSLLYLRTTEEFQRTVTANPQFFRDPEYVNHEDSLFADYYFWAMDATGATFAAVPLAWQIAMDAANRREVSGMGDILLGMNAHINRDLPFVLAAKGLTHPDGSSRKPDHDKVNEFLRRVMEGPVLEEAARRFDPSITATDVPGTRLDSEALFQLVVTWRELAWQNAVRLANAQSSAERQLIASDIEQLAAVEALTYKTATSYLPLLTSTEKRDGHCAIRAGQ